MSENKNAAQSDSSDVSPIKFNERFCEAYLPLDRQGVFTNAPVWVER